MLRKLLQFLTLIAGVYFLADAVLPPLNITTRVDNHQTDTAPATASGGPNQTTYKIYFADNRLSGCSMGHTAYNRLQDGDEVRVRASRLINNCREVRRDHELVYETRLGPFLQALMALITIGVGLGWLRRDDDEGVVLWDYRER